jgi:nitroimidazol reductase NimA-like FMN-containing flavoprotein (pyridoxamine 5'-phosphate oxidase superfamily)
MTSQSGIPNIQYGNAIHELGVEECLELLAASTIGRVAWCGPDGPQVAPMTIGMHEGTVVFRTVAYSALARAVRGATVAVEVDEIDHETRTGWSVVAVGRADTVAEPTELAELWQRGGPEPWAPGVRTLFVRVVPHRVTGRRIEAI